MRNRRRVIFLLCAAALLYGLVFTAPSALAADETEGAKPKRYLYAGYSNGSAVLPDGTIASWGNNGSYQLGDPSLPQNANLAILTDYVSVANGQNATILMKADGTVWICGNGLYGVAPQQVDIEDAYEVYASNIDYEGIFYVLKNDKTLWSWAGSVVDYAALGRSGPPSDPGQVDTITNVMDFDIYDYTCYAVLEDGTVWGWGHNRYSSIPGAKGTAITSPVQIAGLENIVAVAAGRENGAALRDDGTVWTWGNNLYGQLGNGTTKASSIPVQVPNLHDVVAVAAGDGHMLALKSDGTVWAWGVNGYGTLGDHSEVTRTAPVQVKNIKNVTDIEAGAAHSIARTKDGSIYGWGRVGMCLVGTYPGVSSPLLLFDATEDEGEPGGPHTDMPEIRHLYPGENHTLALCEDGTLWSWGHNSEGQLGLGEIGKQESPKQVTGIGRVLLVFPGLNHSFVLCENGSIWAFGRNTDGQLGIGSSDNQFIPVRLV